MKPLKFFAVVASALVLALAALPLRAQPAAEPSVTAARLLPGERLKLDGTLSHPAWQRAPVYADFVERDPVNGAVPPQATRVQVLFDEHALYVGVTALDTAPEKMRAPFVRNDAVNRTQDFVVVYVDAIGKRSSAQFFRVNAAGSMADGLHTAADDSEDFAPDFDWDAATARTPEGWTAVLRLPFASLRFAEGKQEWRFMVARRLPREQFHLITSVPIPNDAPSFIARLQPLAGVELPERHSFTTLRPSVTTRTAKDDGVRRNHTDASLDLKWRPRAELVLDGTLNPDFSQVELDVPQLAGNSRFALFLTEKRPFFFESFDLLRSPTDAFYTRSFTQPRWGLRGTWRGPQWAGSAFAIDDRGGGLVLLPGAYGTGAVEQPAFTATAARARRDDGSINFGALFAQRRYDQGRGDNQVLGPDVAVDINDQWRVRGQWLHSRSTALADASGSLVKGAAQSGDRVRLALRRDTGEGETQLIVDEIGAGFRHDTGFVNQAGVHYAELFQSVGWRGLGPTNAFFLNLRAFQTREQGSGTLVQRVLRPGLYLAGASNLEWWLEANVLSELRTAREAPLLHERYLASGLTVTPAPWFALLDTKLEVGRLADTVANEVRPGLRWSLAARLRPLPALEVEPSLSTAFLRREGELTYRETAQQWLLVWHLAANQSLRAIVQRSVLDRRAEGSAVTAAAALRRTESLTYTWRRSAGTRLYVGVARTRNGREVPATTTEGFVKLQFDVEELLAARS